MSKTHAILLTSQAAAESEETCLICGRQTKGFHCQVNSCRACSAFYKRAIQNQKRYRCQKGDGKCDLTKSPKGKPICRYCRFKKCSIVGMRLESGNYFCYSIIKTDTASVTVSLNLFYELNSGTPETLPSVITSPLINPEKCVTADYHFDGKIFRVNWKSFVESIQEFLNAEPNFVPTFESRQLTDMQKFQIGLDKLVNYGKAKSEIKPFNDLTINREELVNFYLKYITLLCQMLTSLNSFMKFSSNDKFLLFKKFWRGFQDFERLYATCQHFGYDIKDTITLIDNQNVCDHSKNSFVMSVLSTDEKESYLQVTQKFREEFIRNILTPFKQLRITQIELGYLGFLLLWDVQNIPELGPEAIEIANEMIDKASSEMHNYYTYELRSPNYAARLIKLNKLINQCQKQSEEQKQIATMVQVFNLFNYDLIDCKIME